MYGADGQDDIKFENLTGFDNLKAMFYTPCHVSVENNDEFAGQVIGGSVTSANNGNLQFRKVQVPGLGSPIGYAPTILWQAEVPHI